MLLINTLLFPLKPVRYKRGPGFLNATIWVCACTCENKSNYFISFPIGQKSSRMSVHRFPQQRSNIRSHDNHSRYLQYYYCWALRIMMFGWIRFLIEILNWFNVARISKRLIWLIQRTDNKIHYIFPFLKY